MTNSAQPATARCAARYGSPGILALAIFATSLRADPMQFTAATTDLGPGIVKAVSGDSFVDLTDNMLNQQGQFAAFNGRAYVADLRFLGTDQSMQFSSNANGTQVTLKIPSIGFTKTFVGADKAAVEKQVEVFVKQTGSTTISAWTHTINERSKLAPIDGNPQAATAWLNTAAFSRFAFEPAINGNAWDSGAGAGLDVWFDAGSVSTTDGEANTYDLTIGGSARFNNTLGLSWALPIGYRDVEGASTYMGGFILGLPITVIPPAPISQRSSIDWRIVPFGNIAVAASPDLVAGGIVGGGGIASAFDLRVDHTTFTIGNQIDYFGGVPINLEDFHFDTNVNQLIFRNGVKVTQDIGAGGFVDAGMIYTSFYHQAAVDGYFSPVLGLGWRFGKNKASGVRVGYLGDFANGYTGNSGNVYLWFSF